MTDYRTSPAALHVRRWVDGRIDDLRTGKVTFARDMLKTQSWMAPDMSGVPFRVVDHLMLLFKDAQTAAREERVEDALADLTRARELVTR